MKKPGACREAPLGAVVLVAGLVLLLRAGPLGDRAGESPVIGFLRAISSAQALFRETYADKDGVLAYGTLRQLGEAGLVDPVLASGTKDGYRFRSGPSSDGSFAWWAYAEPVPGSTRDRSFYLNQAGVIYFTDSGSPVGTAGVAVVGSHLKPLGQ